jgi:geranylgeranyl pyrophosphate synthase
MMIEDVRRYWEARQPLLEQRLREVMESLEEARVIEVARYIAEGGKRFRGLLTMLTCEAVGGRPEDALDAAVAIELVHASSLALDDIIDGDTYRRGRPASWVVYGVPKTVLVSNLLVPLAQLLVERYGLDTVARTARAWLEVTRGEVLDVFLPGVDGGELYKRIIDYKTASLFELSIYLGLKAAGAGGEEHGEFSEYGRVLGEAYQVADDIVDLERIRRGEVEEAPRIIGLAASWMLGRPAQLPRDAGAAVEAGLRRLRTLVRRASEKALGLPKTSFRGMLAGIPLYMAEKMLGEAGLSLGGAL